MQPTTQSLPRRGVRRYFQFGLKTIIFVTVICAVALTWWRQRSLIAELEDRRIKVERYKTESKLQSNLIRIYQLIDPAVAKHCELSRALQRIPVHRNIEVSVDKRTVLPGWGRGDLEVILFHRNSRSVPGRVATVAVLARAVEIIDFVAHGESTDEEVLEAKLVAEHGGTWADFLILEGTRSYGFMGSQKAQPFRVVYALSDSGFVELIDPLHSDLP